MNKTITDSFSIKNACAFLIISTLSVILFPLLVYKILISPIPLLNLFFPFGLIEILLLLGVFLSYKNLFIPALEKKILLEVNVLGIYNYRKRYKISWSEIVGFRTYFTAMIEIELKEGAKIEALSDGFFIGSISDGKRIWKDLVMIDTKFMKGKRSEIIKTPDEYLRNFKNQNL